MYLRERHVFVMQARHNQIFSYRIIRNVFYFDKGFLNALIFPFKFCSFISPTTKIQWRINNAFVNVSCYWIIHKKWAHINSYIYTSSLKYKAFEECFISIKFSTDGQRFF